VSFSGYFTGNPYSYHRLNGSSSPVLMATSLSYGKAKNSTPHRIETPEHREIKFGRIHYVHENFMQICPRGASPQMGKIYAKIFIYRHTYTFFFFNAPTGQTPQEICTHDGSNNAASGKVRTFQG